MTENEIQGNLYIGPFATYMYTKEQNVQGIYCNLDGRNFQIVPGDGPGKEIKCNFAGIVAKTVNSVYLTKEVPNKGGLALNGNNISINKDGTVVVNFINDEKQETSYGDYETITTKLGLKERLAELPLSARITTNETFEPLEIQKIEYVTVMGHVKLVDSDN